MCLATDIRILYGFDNGNIQVKLVTGGKLALCFELVKWGANVKIKRPKELKEYYTDYLQHILDNL